MKIELVYGNKEVFCEKWATHSCMPLFVVHGCVWQSSPNPLTLETLSRSQTICIKFA